VIVVSVFAPQLRAEDLAMQIQAESIAVIDSGIRNLPDLANRIDPGVDFVDAALPPQDETAVQHGTTVARIAASMDATNRILPIRVLDAGGFTTAARLVQGLDYATASHAKVLNLSVGDPTNTWNPAIASSLRSAAGRGKLLVIAAGNEARRAPSFPANMARFLGGTGLAVGALDRNGEIAEYSNRAGPAMNHYLLAPGFSSFSKHIGTSFAAPYVAGTAAAIFAQNPRLTAAQVSEILRRTAIDMGAPGVDPIYGYGKLNRGGALSAQGTITVPSDSAGGGTGLAAVGLGAGIAAALIYNTRKHRQLGPDVDPDGLAQVVVLDQYERPYTVDLGSMIEVRADSLGLDDLMQSLKRRTEYTDLAITDSLALAIWYGEDELQRFERKTTGQLDDYAQDWSLSLQQGGQTGAYYALNMHLDPRQFFGAADEVSPYAVFDRRSLTAPYAGFAASGNMALAGYRTDKGHDMRLGVISMDDHEKYGLSSRSMLFEGSIRPRPHLKLGLQFAVLSEQGNLLGGSSDGFLSVDHAETLAAGLLAGLSLTPRLSLQLQYSQGYTWVDDSSTSLLDGFTTLRSDSYALGVQGRGVLAEDDSLGVSVSRPLHVNAGRLNLRVPDDINVYTGEVSFDSEVIDLHGTQRETELELGYHLPLGKQTGVAGYLRYRHDPGGVFGDSGNGRYGLMMSLSSTI
jgi:hypothetical protein